MRIRKIGLATAASAALLVATLWSAGVVRADQALSAQFVIRGFTFTPASITVRSGTTVVWINEDDEPHTVVSDGGLFRSGALDTDAAFEFRFDRPGTYHFFCSIHPQMAGTVVVQ